jgi:hypothetical protein
MKAVHREKKVIVKNKEVHPEKRRHDMAKKYGSAPRKNKAVEMI